MYSVLPERFLSFARPTLLGRLTRILTRGSQDWSTSLTWLSLSSAHPVLQPVLQTYMERRRLAVAKELPKVVKMIPDLRQKNRIRVEAFSRAGSGTAIAPQAVLRRHL